MQDNLSIEIRKLEVRLKEFVDAEQKAIESLKKWLKKLKNLNDFIIKISGKEDSESFKQLLKLRLENLKAFQEALKEMSKSEHEKSHLLDSYGSILLALEEKTSKLQKS